MESVFYFIDMNLYLNPSPTYQVLSLNVYSGVWCQEDDLSLNVNKTKEMIVDFGKQQREHPPIHVDGTAVENVGSFKFLGVYITDKLKPSQTFADA
jgi:hypothetical protein